MKHPKQTKESKTGGELPGEVRGHWEGGGMGEGGGGSFVGTVLICTKTKIKEAPCSNRCLVSKVSELTGGGRGHGGWSVGGWGQTAPLRVTTTATTPLSPGN